MVYRYYYLKNTREEMLDRLIGPNTKAWITKTYTGSLSITTVNMLTGLPKKLNANTKNERYSLTDCNASSYNRRASVIF